MRSYAEATWGGTWTPAQDRPGWLASFDPKGHYIIEADGTDVGVAAVEYHASHVQLTKLYLLDRHRNAGIGAQVLGAVACDAMQRGVPLKLRVLAVNVRAQSFYRRHGFTEDFRTSERVHMSLCAANNSLELP